MDDEEELRTLNDFINKNKDDQDYSDVEFEDSDEEDEEEAQSFSLIDGSDDDDLGLTEFETLNENNYSVPPDASLTAEEKQIIDNCTNPEVRDALIINRQKNIQLLFYYKKIENLILELRKTISERRDKLELLKRMPQQSYNGIMKIVAPYFKDHDSFPCKPSSDFFQKRNNNELLSYEICSSSQWIYSNRKKQKLMKAVKTEYARNLKNELNAKIHSLKMKLHEASPSEKKSITKELDVAKNELQVVQNKNEVCPPYKSDKYIDWDRISENIFNGRHSGTDCKYLWHCYLHPDILTDKLSREDSDTLIELVGKYNMQNWDKIAEEMGGQRNGKILTGYWLCCQFMYQLHKFKKNKFTPEEDKKLLKLVDQYKIGDTIQWSNIAHYFSDRNRNSLFHRYTYFLSKQSLKKERFSQEEDVLLLILVDRFGRSFTKCSQYFPHRSCSQLKARFNANLQGSIKKGSFTKEEDVIIMNFVKQHGTKNWSGLSKQLNRARGQIRQRYSILNKYFKNNPNGSIDDVVRRNHKVWANIDSFSFLRHVADTFKGQDIPSLEEIKEVINGFNTEGTKPKADTKKSIDNDLINYFSNYYKSTVSKKNVYSTGLTNLIENIDYTLNILEAKLNIPESLDQYDELDEIDKAVLTNLRPKYTTNNGQCKSFSKKPINEYFIISLIPPNVNTIIGVRSLLIKYESYKNNSSREKIFNSLHSPVIYTKESERISNELSLMTPENKRIMVNSWNTFYKRFLTIFKWSAVLSLESPSQNLRESCNTFRQKIQAVQVYKRKRPPAKNSKANKVQVVEPPGTSQSNYEAVSADVECDDESAASCKEVEGTTEQWDDLSQPSCSYHYEDNSDQ